MVSISGKIQQIKTKVKASIEKERALRKEEKHAFEKAKESESKLQAEFKKFEEAQTRIKRLEKAREAGIKAALPGAKKRKAKEIAKKGLSGISSFLKEHVHKIPEKPSKPRPKKMKHKAMKSKKAKRRRY